MLISAGFLSLHSSVGLSKSSDVKMQDLGVVGKTYRITEIDLSAFIKSRLMEMEKNGSLDAINKDFFEQTKGNIKNPPGRKMGRALQKRVGFYDPRITLKTDIRDAKGRVIFRRGTTVNPLDIKAFNRVLCFIDGNDSVQVEWVRVNCPEGYLHRIILVNGSPETLAKKEKRRFYFDQQASLSRRFGIEALPAVVSMKGGKINVEEIPMP